MRGANLGRLLGLPGFSSASRASGAPLGELLFAKRSSLHVSWCDESQASKKNQKKKANHPEVFDTYSIRESYSYV